VPVGVLDADRYALFDGGAVLTRPDDRCQLRIWVGTEERWRRLELEPALRSRVMSGSPLVRRSLRVSGGDLSVTAYGAIDAGGHPVAVLEVANDGRAPLTLAVVASVDAAPAAPRWQVDGPTVRCDDRVALRAARPWADVAGAGDLDGLVALLDARADRYRAAAPAGPTDAAPAEPAPADPEVLGASGALTARCVALVAPLAHATTTTVVMPLDTAVGSGPAASLAVAEPSGVGSAGPLAVADADTVASGWKRQLDAGARLALPDGRLVDLVAATRAQLLIDPASPAALLARFGHLDAARTRLRHLLADPLAELAQRARELVDLGGYLAVDPDRVAAEACLERLAELVALLERAERAPGATDDLGPWRRAAGDVLVAAGQHDVAAAIVAANRVSDARAHPAAGAGASAVALEAAGRWSTLSGAADDAGVWGTYRTDRAAEFLDAVRDLLVDDSDAAVLRVAPGFPASWWGQPVEVYDLPTRSGLLSYALRWHGERPALLWDVRDPAARDLSVSCPGLDPAWRAQGARGDALLDAPSTVAPPGAAGPVEADGSFS